MNAVSPDKTRAVVVARIAGLFLLAVAAIAFFASPMLAFAADAPPETGVDDSQDETPPQPATFVAAFRVEVGTKPNDIPTFVPEPNFKSAVTGVDVPVEVVKLKLNNNKIVVALFEDHDDNVYGYASGIQQDAEFKFKLPES